MTHWRLILTVAALVVFSAVITSQTPSGHAVFEQALAKERVEGNLLEAIRLYERVVAEFASDRALAAQALVQVGLCYEKLGRDEAIRAYERLVRDFTDQEDAVAQARVRLAVLKRPVAGTPAAAPTAGVRAFPRVDRFNEVQALSPDGTKAAFFSYDRRQNLAVYDVPSQRTILLTNFDQTPTSPLLFSPVWSPDGRRIAYAQCGQGPDSVCELCVTSLSGVSEVIFRNQANPGKLAVPGGWLPDGSALVILVVRADNTSSIGLLPTAGGRFTPLRSLSWMGQYPEPPTVSPDGRLIAFSEGSPGARDVHVISTDGRAVRRITDHPADDHRPLWSPDGRSLAFLSTRNGNAALWAVSIKNGQPDAEPVRIKDGIQDDDDLLGWTTRGLAYRDRLWTDDIYTVPVNPATGEPVGSPRQIPYRRTGRNIAPAWSPDGTSLAFVSSTPGEPDRRSVVVLPSGGGEPREFPIPTSRYVYQHVPADLRWFGDGRGLGFSGIDTRGDGALFRLTLAGGEWRTIPLPVATFTRVEWNSDGSRFFYARQDPTGNEPAIVERDLHSDREQIVFRGRTADRYFGLRFSPDRRVLAIQDNGGRIVVVDVESGKARVVHDKTTGGTLSSEAVPTWSTNGRALLVPVMVRRADDAVTRGSTSELRLIAVDGADVRRIPLDAELTRLVSSGSVGNISWSPDGGTLAFVLTSSRLETWLIENPLAGASAANAGGRK